MSRHQAPRRGSVAHRALERLHQLGGKATYADIIVVMTGEYRSIRRFVSHVVDKLESGKQAFSSGDTMEITALGRDVISVAPVLPVTVPDMPGPMYRPAPKPLDLSRLRASTGRPGALDYRSIPSLMGGERVPFMGEGNAND